MCFETTSKELQVAVVGTGATCALVCDRARAQGHETIVASTAPDARLGALADWGPASVEVPGALAATLSKNSLEMETVLETHTVHALKVSTQRSSKSSWKHFPHVTRREGTANSHLVGKFKRQIGWRLVVDRVHCIDWRGQNALLVTLSRKKSHLGFDDLCSRVYACEVLEKFPTLGDHVETRPRVVRRRKRD